MKHLLSNFGQRFSAQTHLEIKQLQAVRILLQNSISCAYRFLTHQPSIKCIRSASCSYVECVPLHSRVGVGVWVVKHLEVRLPASKRTDCCISVVSMLLYHTYIAYILNTTVSIVSLSLSLSFSLFTFSSFYEFVRRIMARARKLQSQIFVKHFSIHPPPQE